MKKVIAWLVIGGFLLAMPRPVYADHRGADPAALGIAFGAVAFIIGVVAWISGSTEKEVVKDNNKTQNEMHKREEGTARLLAGCRATNGPGVVRIKGGGVEDGEVSCNRYPPEPESLEQAKQYGFLPQQTIVQPIAQAQPLHYSRSGREGDSESSLYRAGKDAARNGVEVACANTNDYCRGYNAAIKGR